MTLPFAGPPLSLRVSVTDRCSLRCTYCMPASGAPGALREDVLSFDQIVRFAGELQASYGLEQVRITGGEPLVRAEIDRLVTMLAAAGAPDLALTTNGQQLEGLAGRLKRAGLKRINISLDTLNRETFASITRGGVLDKTLAGIEAARRAGLYPIKLNTVVLRGQNENDAGDLVRFAMEHDCQIRFLELMPIGVSAAGFDERFVSSAEVRERLSGEFRLTALRAGSHETSRNFVAEDGCGRSTIVGFISPYSEPFCSGCRRLRLTSTGVLIGCLARSEGIPLAPLLRRGRQIGGEEIREAVERALGLKRRNGEFVQPMVMVGIGG